MNGLRFAYALGAALAISAFSACADEAPTPMQMVVDLQNLQVKIAQGDAAAYAAQPAMLRDIAIGFAAAKPEVWKSPENCRAAVAYLLSGGAPRAIAPALESNVAPKEEENLIRGALAYVVGREEEAQNLLGGLDVKALDLRLAAQIAFAQSVLVTAKDKKKALELLDLARLLAPGGLIEEAALRREVFLAGDIRDIDRFTLLSRQYISRFPHSVYADNFLRSFAAIVARLGLAEDLANFRKFDSLTAALSPDNRRALFLTIARGALINAKIEVADASSRMAMLQAAPGGQDEARGELYHAIARLVTDGYDEGFGALRTLDGKKLSKRDALLLAAARAVADRLRAPDQAPDSQTAPQAPSPPAADADAMATIQLAEAAVARSDSLVGEKKR